MKVDVRSWAKWNDDGLIEVNVDRDVLKKFVKEYESQIAMAVCNKNYPLTLELISKRNRLVEKLEEYDGGCND